MNRREFLSWAGVGWVAASLPIAIAACAPSTPPSSETPASSTESEPASESESVSESSASASEPAEVAMDTEGFLVAGTTTVLDAEGSISLKDQEIVIIRDPINTAAVLAFTSICNHLNCQVDWQGEANEFICPCHGSKFGIDGSLVKGPATEGLTLLEVKLEGENILVKV